MLSFFIISSLIVSLGFFALIKNTTFTFVSRRVDCPTLHKKDIPKKFKTVLLLRKYNMLQYERSKMNNTRYTLSEKFQISENVRSLRILWRSLLAGIACIIVITAVSFFA